MKLRDTENQLRVIKDQNRLFEKSLRTKDGQIHNLQEKIGDKIESDIELKKRNTCKLKFQNQ